MKNIWLNVKRNSLAKDFYTIIPVEDFNIFAGFLCSQPDAQERDLENFLATDAYQHSKDRIAVTYTLVAITDPRNPLGFATLANDAIVVDFLSVSGYLKNEPRPLRQQEPR